MQRCSSSCASLFDVLDDLLNLVIDDLDILCDSDKEDLNSLIDPEFDALSSGIELNTDDLNSPVELKMDGVEPLLLSNNDDLEFLEPLLGPDTDLVDLDPLFV